MRYIIDRISDEVYGERVSNNLVRDNNGQLICENVVLARTGYYDYRESELIPDGSPDKIVKVYRSPEEVFNPISMKSMNYKPLVDDHPEENVTPDTVSYLQKGFMTNIRRGVGEFDGCLMADLIATDPVVIDEILTKKKRDLSVGYTADIEEVDGQYIMKNIRGNHIALCEAGRAGNARIRDSIDAKDAEDTYYASVEVHSGHSEYMTSNDQKAGDRIVTEAVRSSGVKEKKSWYKTFFIGTRSQVQSFVNACGRLDDYLFIVMGPEKASDQFLKQLGDSEITDAVPVKVKGVEYRNGDFSVLSYSDKPNTFIVVKNYTGENPYNGGGTVEFSLAGAKKTADDFVIMENLEKKYGKSEGYKRWMAGKNDAAISDFEAKGSFDTISELRSYYPGASVEARGKDVIVRLLSGVKLLYVYLNGSDGKLLFVRRVTDSVRDGVEVLGDSHKLRVGQRIKYFGEPCVVTNITPNIRSGEFIVEFGGGGQVCGRQSYDEVVQNINQGKIKLLDSVVFDRESGDFTFESTDCDMSEDYSDSFKDNYADCFSDSKYKSGDKVRPREGGDVEVIEKIIEEDTAGHDRSGKKVTKYLMKSGRKYLAEDLEGNAWTKVSDSAGALRSFRVSVGDKKFDTTAHSAAEAMQKVRAAVADAMPKNYVMYRPSTKSYLQVGSSIMGGTVYEGPSVSSAARYDKIPASALVGDLNRLMTKLGHKADWVTKEITEKDLGIGDAVYGGKISAPEDYQGFRITTSLGHGNAGTFSAHEINGSKSFSGYLRKGDLKADIREYVNGAKK